MATGKPTTFVDASVLINAAVGPNAARRMRALAALGDPTREFVATRLLVLEVIPVPTKFKKVKICIAAAVSASAELISAEKPSKPIYGAYSNVSSVY